MTKIIACPKCSSISLSDSKKGYSVGKAAAGLLIPGGILWGLHGRNKIIITCLSCGHKFKPGEGKSIDDNISQSAPHTIANQTIDNRPVNPVNTGSNFDTVIGAVVIYLIGIVMVVLACVADEFHPILFTIGALILLGMIVITISLLKKS